MNGKKTILIIDDHPLFREGLKSLLEKLPNYTMVGGAGTWAEGLEKVQELRPDLVVMDISLPDGNGIELARTIRESCPETQVVMLSMYSKISYITEAFKAGATGYLVKESATESIIECLGAISNGEYFIDPSLSHTVVECLKKSTDTGPSYGVLTPREQQVLRLIAEGLPTKEIAEKLFISTKTAENHKTNILSKLQLHSTLDLVRYAAKLGLIDVDLWKT